MGEIFILKVNSVGDLKQNKHVIYWIIAVNQKSLMHTLNLLQHLLHAGHLLILLIEKKLNCFSLTNIIRIHTG